MRAHHSLAWSAAGLLAALTTVTLSVPTDVQMPGTQPLEVGGLQSVGNCDNCHGGYDPAVEPSTTWRGGMMAQAGRDPLFWATVAVAEQDFPGAGDLCIRCHSPRGWLEGRSSPTDGSALAAGDGEGVECELCHLLVDPDDSEHIGVQNAPFIANDGGNPPRAYRGNGMFVLWPGGERLGPYADSVARHPWLQSKFHRSADLCATCHDVSNPAVGDVAHNNGSIVPLAPGTFSGAFGGPVTGKAAFLNFPHRYGAVERTSSEHAGSTLAATAVRDYGKLPEELQDGAIRDAYEAALLAGRGGDFEDGTQRDFTCQSCHMRPVVAKGADKANAPLRRDLPRHDLVGGNTWAPDAIAYLDGKGLLVLGGGMSSGQLAALAAGKERAEDMLESAAALSVVGDVAKVVNLTGHKLTTGYPEGRRMWLRTTWRDANGTPLRIDGEYGPMSVSLQGRTLTVRSLLDPHDPRSRVWHAEPGMTSEWARQLLTAGVPASLALKLDRTSGAVLATLGDLGAMPAGSALPTFRFVLNNTFVADSRIPPYGFRYDDARLASTLPVPPEQFGDPGPGGIYRHWDEVTLDPPALAAYADVELLYQTTSWEYVQFLVLANDGSVSHLAQTGQQLLDAWLNTGMAEPVVMAETLWCAHTGTGDDLRLRTELDGEGERDLCRKDAHEGERLAFTVDSPGGALHGALAALVIELYVPGSPPLSPLPGVHFDRTDVQITVPALGAGGFGAAFDLPAGLAGFALRMQGVALSAAAANGLYASSDAHDVAVR